MYSVQHDNWYEMRLIFVSKKIICLQTAAVRSRSAVYIRTTVVAAQQNSGRKPSATLDRQPPLRVDWLFTTILIQKNPYRRLPRLEVPWGFWGRVVMENPLLSPKKIIARRFTHGGTGTYTGTTLKKNVQLML